MHYWTRRLLAIAASVLLTGCLWGPGKFTSDLTLKTGGSFVLDYRGEIVLMLPPEETETAEPWTDSMAVCYADGGAELNATRITVSSGTVTSVDEPDSQGSEPRPCTAAETAELKQQYEHQAAQRASAKLKQTEEMAKIFGLPGLDDESNRAFAAKLMKYDGWRSVTYRGDGVYDVDYHFEGRATQDFQFPALPDNDIIIPFISIRKRADGSLLVTAPALVGGAGPLAARAGAAASSALKGPPPSRAEGRLTIITDGEILTNNTEDGTAPHPLGRQVRWEIGPGSKKVPETLIRL